MSIVDRPSRGENIVAPAPQAHAIEAGVATPSASAGEAAGLRPTSPS
jgi:hypothetical protein